MSWLSRLAALVPGNPAAKVVDDVFDKDTGLLKSVGGFINDLNLTDEERVKYAADAAAGAAKFAIDTMGENTERSKTRRSVAVDWVRVFLLMQMLTIAAWPINQDYAKFILAVSTSGIMAYGTGAVITFFFGGYYLNGRQLPGFGKRKDGKS